MLLEPDDSDAFRTEKAKDGFEIDMATRRRSILLLSFDFAVDSTQIRVILS